MRIEVPWWRKIMMTLPWIIIGVWYAIEWLPLSLLVVPLSAVMTVYNGLDAFKAVEVGDDNKARLYRFGRVIREVDLKDYLPQNITETASTMVVFFSLGAKFVNDANPKGIVIGMRMMDSTRYREFVKLCRERSAALHGIISEPQQQHKAAAEPYKSSKYDE